ncbi:venom dipeptidyl peptidase 4 isoform X1 [Anthonomus grandis grandis]|uniref:venom dipeptidyl peptidase 4 isoform X1 n=1 Tax=Anthonomus grandis grandis TaxID=2921223 RepID=UPI002164F0DC|nr:venom dipeptidyl peptidase 4 isoform X1 [Anthonomus grandis grandis]
MSHTFVADLLRTKSSRKKRNWIVAVVVGAIVVALIIAGVALLSNGKGHESHAEEQTAETINLEDFLNYKYNPKGFNGTWISGDKFLYKNNKGDVLLYNIGKNTNTVLLYANDSIVLQAFDFKISADNKYLLVGYRYQKLYRYSYKAQYTTINLSNPSQRKELVMGENRDFLLVEWAPTGNGLVYVFENNIYYKASAESDDYDAVTTSNNKEFITNGIPDWVYEEEVFSSNKALWFSDDGENLAYARFNDTEVNIMVVPIYGDPGNLGFQYPRAIFVKYPKAGTPNPIVDLFIYNVKTKKNTILEKTDDLKSDQPILSAVTWATNNSLLAVWMNRVQNHANVVVYQELSSSPTTVKNIQKSTGWVELFVPPIVSETGTQIALLLSKDEGTSAGAYRHLALLDVKENATEEFLTGGTYVVTEVLGWNHDKNLIFYTATTPNDSTVQHLYSVSPITKTTTCLSCPLKSKNGKNNCLYNSAEVSTDSSYIIITCNGPDIPHISILSSEGEELLQWTTNEELVELLGGKTLHGRAKFEFNIAGGFTAKVMLKLPPNMDISGNTKYPMLVNVYGGPDTYQVTDKYNLDWGSYLASNKSIIYATIDGRGSGLRGDNLLFSGYRKLGTVEVIDQINVTKLIQQNVPYVDPSRTAIWGWSYGGYAAGMALATDTENIFKCGISVAPVTDWALYDSIYTERFMGLPNEDNYEGYVQAQLLTKYAGLKNKEYFLIHGTFDDNVHYQQSMMWAKVLERNDVLFRQLSYTDEDHSLNSVRPHLYHSLENFLDECFAKDS